VALEALIFDVDGTLAETERDGHRIAFNQAFAATGLDWHWDVETYGRLLAVTGGKERLLHYWREFDPSAAGSPEALQIVRELHRQKTGFYARIVASGRIALRAGVRRFLSEAREQGYRLGIATTTSPENVDFLVRSSLGVGCRDVFECIGAGDVVSRKKPAPDIYEWVLREMRLSPGQCVAFEDSPTGLEAAMRAGLRAIVTPGEYSRGAEFPGAFALLDDLGDTALVLAMLERC
jgi:HAD superfamily hydrolase (TIGR01509 family)